MHLKNKLAELIRKLFHSCDIVIMRVSKIRRRDYSSNYMRMFPRINFARDRGRYCIAIADNLYKVGVPRARNLNFESEKFCGNG